MYNNEKVEWFSQTLMTYKDKAYATDGYMRLSISTNTEDFKHFNPPSLNLSISNNYQKSINLNIQNAKDLIKAFKSILPQINGDELSIQRKYQKNTVLHFTFKLDPNSTERIVVIEVRNNETDFTKIVIPLSGVFETLASCIREFAENYMSICTQLFMNSIQSQSTQIIHQLPSLIKGISSQIVSQDIILDSRPDSRAPEIEEQTVAETQSTIEDLNKFLGDNMSNIDIPEIEKVEKEIEKPVEVDSIFVNRFIDGDLKNLESFITNCFMTPAPILVFSDGIKDLGKYIDNENFTPLPSINEHDLKSLVYLSKLHSSILYQNYHNSSAPLPATVPVFKYNPQTYTDENMEIAYDLFLFNLYIRTLRRRLENKIEDAINNKALFNIQLRCFTDPFVFSFIEKADKTKLSSMIMTRYKYYESIGVFDSYKKLLEETKCPVITELDILSVVDEAIEKVLGKTPYIEQLHDNMNTRLPSKNTMSLEQITNEIIPLEIAEKTGKDIKNDVVIQDLKQKHNISDEVLKLFKDEKKKRNVKKRVQKTKVSNLERLIRTEFIDEIPEQYRDNFVKYLLDLGNNKFEIDKCEFPIDEFGDNVVKSLYLWDPDNDPVISKNYKKFFLKVEEEIMERDLIFAKIGSPKEDVKSSSDWDFLSS